MEGSPRKSSIILLFPDLTPAFAPGAQSLQLVPVPVLGPAVPAARGTPCCCPRNPQLPKGLHLAPL